MIIQDSFKAGKPSAPLNWPTANDATVDAWAMLGNRDAIRELLKRHGNRSLRFNPYHDAKGRFTTAISAGVSLDSLSPEGKAVVAANLAAHGLTQAAIEKEIESELKPGLMADAKAWYPNANKFANQLAAKYGVTPAQAAAVISAVSPRTPWPRNQVLAERVLDRHDDYPQEMDAKDVAARIGGGFKRNLALAVEIARGEPIDDTLTGVKRRSFYNNIAHPGKTDSVTVDTWMLESAVRASTSGMTKDDATGFLGKGNAKTGGVGPGYISISEAVKAVAARNGMAPDEVQSAYWIATAGGVKGSLPGD